MIVIAANAGGAWSPMGDVTTTMLWIGGQVTTMAIITKLILPSLVNMARAAGDRRLRAARQGRSSRRGKADEPSRARATTTPFERNLMFAAGLLALVSVPVFKTVTHLPPFLGMLFGLGILWAVGDRVHVRKAV